MTKLSPTNSRHHGLARRAALIAALFLGVPLSACGSNTPRHEHPEPLSAEQHEQHAKAHEAQAQIDRERVEAPAEGEDAQCIEVGGPLNSGGERTKVMKPCWTKAEQNAAYLRAAETQKKAAADHRHWAELLIEAEAEACSSLAPSERETSPFVRGPDILSVVKYEEGGELRGATATFRKVVGLSKAWLESSIRCHQARAAKLGYEEDFMPYCPLALPKVGTSVTDQGETLVVTLRSTDPIIAAKIYGRALHSKNEDSAQPKDDDTAQP